MKYEMFQVDNMVYMVELHRSELFMDLIKTDAKSVKLLHFADVVIDAETRELLKARQF